MKKIYLDAPCVGELEKEYLSKAVDSGYISSCGPFVSEFEEKMARYLGVSGAVALQNGTEALHIALYALGIGPGDEVIVPALTFIATVNPILYVGATPIIVDVKTDTWNIDSEKIRAAITPKTKAIIPVHLYGNPCDMTSILEIAEEYNIYIIEDAAESLGAKYKGKQTGVLGDVGCFSFNGNKLITTGGGGLFVAKNKELLKRVRFLINQAKDENISFYHQEMGFNYRMTNIQAALGLAQLKRLDGFLAKKREIFKVYERKLSDYVLFQRETPNAVSSRWLSAGIDARDNGVFRDKIITSDIPVRRIFMPLNKMPYLANVSGTKVNQAEKIYNEGLCFPSSVLNDKLVDIAEKVKEIICE